MSNLQEENTFDDSVDNHDGHENHEAEANTDTESHDNNDSVNTDNISEGNENDIVDENVVKDDGSVVDGEFDDTHRESLVKNLLNAVVRVQIDSIDDLLRFKDTLGDNGFHSFESEAFMSDYEVIQQTAFIAKEKAYELFYGVKEFGLQTEELENIEERLLNLVNTIGTDLQFLYGVMTQSDAKTVVFQMDGSEFTKSELS